MKYLIFILALSLPLSAQISIRTITVDESDADQVTWSDSLESRQKLTRAALSDSVSVSWVDSVVTADTLAVPMLGPISALPDSLDHDGLWVVVEIPAAVDSSGAVKALASNALVAATEDPYNGKRVSTTQVRLHRKQAAAFRRALVDALK